LGCSASFDLGGDAIHQNGVSHYLGFFWCIETDHSR